MPVVFEKKGIKTNTNDNDDDDNNDDDDDNDDNEIGFSQAIRQFDSCIDTLGDEAKLFKVNSIQAGIDRFCGKVGVIDKLKKKNQCQR